MKRRLKLLSHRAVRVLPVLLKQFHASDQQIAIMIGSIPALLSLVMNPVVSYRSDRKRHRWGRRIPYLVWAAPFASIFLVAISFAPEISGWLRLPELHLFGESWAPAVVGFAGLCVLFQCFQSVISAVYFYLFRDTVPAAFMGRFLGLMRVFSALGVFVTNYWMLGLAEQHSKAIFIGVAVINLVGYWAMCYFVREGEYPPVEPPGAATSVSTGWGLIAAVHTFAKESFSDPIYWWTYGARLLVYAALPISGYTILFAHQELNLGYDTAGKVLAIPSIMWLLFAFSAGRWIEKKGAAAVLVVATGLSALFCAVSFVGVIGIKTFYVSSILIGMAYWLVMLTQVALAQEIFPAARMGQFSSANVVLQSVVIALLTTPATGWLLDTLKGVETQVAFPWGTVVTGSYRFSFLILALVYALFLPRPHPRVEQGNARIESCGIFSFVS